MVNKKKSAPTHVGDHMENVKVTKEKAKEARLKAVDQMHSVFHIISRIVIVIPVLILVVVLFMYLGFGYFREKPELQGTIISPEPTLENLSQVDTLDLSGPYVCTVNDNGMRIDAHIKDYRVHVAFINKTEKEHLVLDGDCLYHWGGTTNKGVEYCGIDVFMTTLTMLSSSDIMDVETLFTLSTAFIEDEDAQNVANKLADTNVEEACAKKEFSDKVFAIPEDVTFVSESIMEDGSLSRDDGMTTPPVSPAPLPTVPVRENEPPTE